LEEAKYLQTSTARFDWAKVFRNQLTVSIG